MKRLKILKKRKALAWRYILIMLIGLMILLIAILIIGKSRSESAAIISTAKNLF